MGVIERAPKYRKQKLAELKGEVDNAIITLGDLSTILSVISRPSRLTDEDSEDSNSTEPSRVHVPLTSTRNILQGRPLAGPQNRSQ